MDSMDKEKLPGAIVFSCLADKQPEELTSLVRVLAHGRPLFVPTIQNNPRAAESRHLAAMLGGEATATDTLQEALAAAQKAAHGQPVLVCGSLYLLSEFFTLWPDLLLPPGQNNSPDEETGSGRPS